MADMFGATNVAPVLPKETTPTEDNPLDIVKEKFKNEQGELDVTGLAKGKIEADKHIAKLESELRGLRGELDTRLNYEQFLEEIKTSRQTPAQQDNQQQRDEVKALGKDDIAALVKEVVNQERTQAQKDSNLRQAQQGVIKAFGSNYADKLSSALADLGVSEDFARSIAETNPTAFLKMIGGTSVPQAPMTSTAPPQGSFRMDPSTGKRDLAYYEKMRKADPRTYWTPKVQGQMHRDMFEQGEEFGIKLS